VLSGSLAAAGAALAGGARSQGAAQPGNLRPLHARTSGYDGIVPGPALQVRRGEEVWVRLTNDLPDATAVHWHGVRLINAMDGAPPLTQMPIHPGETFDYRFIAPDAGSYWYHSPDWSHPGERLKRGLYGALIVTEADPVDVDHDLTLIFDRALPSGAAADVAATEAAPFTVNGAADFDIRARTNERLRLRLLNAAPGQILGLRIGGLRTFVMATDGEPAEPFAAREGRLLLGPGNRMDVFVDCTLAPGITAPITVEGAPGAAPIARIVCEAASPSRTSPRDDPHPLPANPLPERMDFAGAFRLDAAVGQFADHDTAHDRTALFTVKRGRTVVLGLSNPTLENQFIHLHGHHFRLLDALDDGWKPFWLDSLPISSQGGSRIAFVADNPGRWLLEGLTTKSGANAWFEVA
jgi:FtsP/CotA-like multicopper oxidase with cupredoxin domain